MVSNTEPYIVNVSNLNLDFSERTILSDISFTVHKPEIISIIGPNGAGKSSLLKCLIGEHKHQGNISLFNGEYELRSYEERARMLAVLPQSSQLNFPFSVNEVALMGRMPHATGQKADQEIVNHVLEEMDIIHFKHTPYTQLSGGEKQRVQLARVLVQIWQTQVSGPRLLLLDEPTSALDIAHQHILMRSLRALCADQVSIVMVMHDFNLAAHYADRIITLNNGELYSDGTAAEQLTATLFKDVFNVQAHILTHPIHHKPIITIL